MFSSHPSLWITTHITTYYSDRIEEAKVPVLLIFKIYFYGWAFPQSNFGAVTEEGMVFLLFTKLLNIFFSVSVCKDRFQEYYYYRTYIAALCLYSRKQSTGALYCFTKARQESCLCGIQGELLTVVSVGASTLQKSPSVAISCSEYLFIRIVSNSIVTRDCKS